MDSIKNLLELEAFSKRAEVASQHVRNLPWPKAPFGRSRYWHSDEQFAHYEKIYDNAKLPREIKVNSLLASFLAKDETAYREKADALERSYFWQGMAATGEFSLHMLRASGYPSVDAFVGMGNAVEK